MPPQAFQTSSDLLAAPAPVQGWDTWELHSTEEGAVPQLQSHQGLCSQLWLLGTPAIRGAGLTLKRLGASLHPRGDSKDSSLDLSKGGSQERQREGMGAFEASRAGGVSRSQVQPSPSRAETGKAVRGGVGVRFGQGSWDPAASPAARRWKAALAGAQTGGQTRLRAAPGGNSRSPVPSRLRSPRPAPHPSPQPRRARRRRPAPPGSPRLRTALWCGRRPPPSSAEQFQRWSRSWC